VWGAGVGRHVVCGFGPHSSTLLHGVLRMAHAMLLHGALCQPPPGAPGASRRNGQRGGRGVAVARGQRRGCSTGQGRGCSTGQGRAYSVYIHCIYTYIYILRRAASPHSGHGLTSRGGPRSCGLDRGQQQQNPEHWAPRTLARCLAQCVGRAQWVGPVRGLAQRVGWAQNVRGLRPA
jgi:hypothetical protein